MIPYILAAVGGYLIGDSLKGKKYAYGGKVEYVGDDPYDQKYFRRFNNAIGSFAWKYDGNYNEGILYPLDTFDKEYYSHIALKKDEVLLRYRTDRMLKDEKHLIKFNLDKALIYFMTDSDDDKNPKFETRGIKAEYIVISKEYAPKIMADGGMMDRGGLFTNKKYRFIFEKNGEVHGINYELIGIQADGTEDVISEHTTQSGAEKKAKNWQKTASPKYVSWEIRIKKFADGGMMAKGGMIRKGSYFHVLKGMDGIKRFRVKDIEGNKVTTEYTKNDGTIVTNNNEQKDNLEWLLENGHIKKVTEKEYWDKQHDNYAKGGTIDEQLEKINIYNDLDEFEYRQYKRMVDSGISKVDALKVLINNVEGDTSQLSKKLASVAKKIKY